MNRFQKYLPVLALVLGLVWLPAKHTGFANPFHDFSCVGCHSDPYTLIPANHPDPTAAEGVACSDCHAFDASDKAEKRPYSAFVHRAHAGQTDGAGCMDCHATVAEKGFRLPGTAETLGSPSASTIERLAATTATWADSPYMDALHGKRGVTCGGCHGLVLPEVGDTVGNKRCLACHGPLDVLVKKTIPKEFPDRNPHESHLGDIDCTVCHVAHGASSVYCLDCHQKFDMRIPGG